MRRLSLFARAPLQGTIKTRLAPALTPALTLALYRAMLLDALGAGGEADVHARAVWWAEAGSADDPEVRSALEEGGWRECTQPDGDLGARLTVTFAELLRDPADHAVVFGADCPTLDAAAILQAFRELERADVVLGPAGDGGYTLIGLRHAAPALFADVAWSTDRVLQQTLDRAEEAGLVVTLLPRRDDVDTPADLVRCVARDLTAPRGTEAAQAPAAPWSAPRLGARTRATLRALGLLP